MAVIETVTGSYDDAKTYTAHELAADHWWIDENYLAKVVGGHALWEHVQYRDGGGNGENVLVWRLDGSQGLKVFKRYVDPETPMRLIK